MTNYELEYLCQEAAGMDDIPNEVYEQIGRLFFQDWVENREDDDEYTDLD